MPKKKKQTPAAVAPTESLKNVEEQAIVSENVAAIETVAAESVVEEPVAAESVVEPVVEEPTAAESVVEPVVEEPTAAEEQWIEKKVNSMRLRNEPSIFVNTIDNTCTINKPNKVDSFEWVDKSEWYDLKNKINN